VFLTSLIPSDPYALNSQVAQDSEHYPCYKACPSHRSVESRCEGRSAGNGDYESETHEHESNRYLYGIALPGR
jgi:hypothetical protein